MSTKNIRRGVTNARFNQENSGILMAEIFIIAIVAGVVTKSWLAGGGIFAALIIGLQFSVIAIPLMLLLSLGWGAIGFGFGSLFDSAGASWVSGIFAFLCGVGVHMAGIQWMQDISRE